MKRIRINRQVSEAVDVFSDGRTTVSELRELVRKFVDERDWSRYHSPKNVAISISLEASELLEHFQWSPPAPEDISPEERQEIGEEMADVLAYLLSLANVLDVDLAAELQRKMHKNQEKYPTEEFHGKWEKKK